MNLQQIFDQLETYAEGVGSLGEIWADFVKPGDRVLFVGAPEMTFEQYAFARLGAHVDSIVLDMDACNLKPSEIEIRAFERLFGTVKGSYSCRTQDLNELCPEVPYNLIIMPCVLDDVIDTGKMGLLKHAISIAGQTIVFSVHDWVNIKIDDAIQILCDAGYELEKNSYLGDHVLSRGYFYRKD